MAESYIRLIAKIKQKNDGKFFLLDAEDIEYKGKALTDAIAGGEFIGQRGQALYLATVDVVPDSKVALGDIVRGAEVKVGDSILDVGGDVYDVTAVADDGVTVGKVVLSLKGPQGERGADGAKGDTGATGTRGSNIRVVESAPGAVEGFLDGDITIQKTADDAILFVFESGAWVNKGSIKGAVGAKGDKGDQGEKGEQGVQGPQGDQGNPFPVAKIKPND